MCIRDRLAVVLQTVAVAEIDHHATGQAACGELVHGGLDGGSIEVGAGLATAEDDVAGVVATCLHAVSYTHLRAHETVLALVCRLLLEKKKHRTHQPIYTIS